MTFFLISSMVLGLLDQLLVFWWLCLIELLRLLTDRATWAVALDISKALDRIWHARLLHKLKLYGVSGQIFGLILFFLVIDDFEWFWMVSLKKNTQLTLEFLKVSFLVQKFSYYRFMTFLMIMSVILPLVLMILLSTLCVIRHVSCSNNYNGLLSLNLIYETLWNWAGSGLLISMLEKLDWFGLTYLITLVLLMRKWMGLFLRNSSDLFFSSKLDWGS